MTTPDSLERIVEEMKTKAHKWWGGPQREDTLEFAARIEALIPSKAEREFLEAAVALAHFAKERRGEPMDAVREDRAIVWQRFEDAYLALLAERGK